METEGRGNIEFGVANQENDEIVLKRKKLLEAKRHLLLLEEQIQDLHLVLKRFSRKHRSQKCQYSLKQRLAVLSGKYSTLFYYSLNIKENFFSEKKAAL